MIAALVLHIGGGIIGILTGAIALCVHKGGALHRRVGAAFFVAIFTMATMGTAMAITLRQPGNILGGTVTLYMVGTAWLTVHRRAGTTGRAEIAALAAGFAGTAAAFALGFYVASLPGGTLDNVPAAAPFIFAVVTMLASCLDLRVVRRGGITGRPRIVRHLWRTCTGLFITTTSFFIGQQQVMPLWLQGSPILLAPAFAPLAVMAFWLIRIRWQSQFRRLALAA